MSSTASWFVAVTLITIARIVTESERQKTMESDREEVHKRIDKMHETLTGVRIELTRIGERLPVQPCQQLMDHIKKHEDAERKRWAIYVKLIGAVASSGGISGLVVWFLGSN